LIAIVNDKLEQGVYGKKMVDDQTIEEGEFDENKDIIKGYRWKLKEDGTYDKYKFEKVARKKEENEEESKDESEREEENN
jgi:hypothetical protein